MPKVYHVCRDRSTNLVPTWPVRFTIQRGVAPRNGRNTTLSDGKFGLIPRTVTTESATEPLKLQSQRAGRDGYMTLTYSAVRRRSRPSGCRIQAPSTESAWWRTGTTGSSRAGVASPRGRQSRWRGMASVGQCRNQRLSRCRCPFREVEVCAQQRNVVIVDLPLRVAVVHQELQFGAASVDLFQPGRLLYEWYVYELLLIPLTVNALPPIVKRLMQERDLVAHKWPGQAAPNAVS